MTRHLDNDGVNLTREQIIALGEKIREGNRQRLAAFVACRLNSFRDGGVESRHAQGTQGRIAEYVATKGLRSQGTPSPVFSRGSVLPVPANFIPTKRGADAPTSIVSPNVGPASSRGSDKFSRATHALAGQVALLNQPEMQVGNNVNHGSESIHGDDLCFCPNHKRFAGVLT